LGIAVLGSNINQSGQATQLRLDAIAENACDFIQSEFGAGGLPPTQIEFLIKAQGHAGSKHQFLAAKHLNCGEDKFCAVLLLVLNLFYLDDLWFGLFNQNRCCGSIDEWLPLQPRPGTSNADGNNQ
jgi:hypothetical protein